MNTDNTFSSIVLYGLKDSRRKIAAIKVLRAIAQLRGGKLGLKAAKDMIDNIERAPIEVDGLHRDERPIVLAAIEAHFLTHAPESRKVRLGAFVQYDEPMVVDTPWGDPVLVN